MWSIHLKDRHEIVGLAWPTILGMVGSTLMGLVDTAMVGRLSAEALAAVGLGNMIIWAIGSLVNSVNVGVQTVSARRFGEGRFSECGESLHNGILLSIVAGTVLTALAVFFLHDFFAMINDDARVIVLGDEYMMVRLYGILPSMLFFAAYGFFNGVGHTKVHFQVSLISNSLNILINYALIFGKWGCPAMGVRGAAVGTVIATWIAALNYFIWLFHPAIRHRFHLFRGKWFNVVFMKRIVNLSLASGLQNFFVLIGFTIFMVIVGRIGTIELAATDIIFNILSISFMPGQGFGLAAGTLVGKYMGERRFDRAQDLAWQTILINVLFMGSMGLIFIFFPRQILVLFTSEPSVIEIGSIPLRILGFVQFIDAVGMTLMGALRGAGDTAYVAYADTLLNWFVFLPITWFLGVFMKMGVNGAWSAFIVYLVAFAAVLGRRFVRGKWKSIVV